MMGGGMMGGSSYGLLGGFGALLNLIITVLVIGGLVWLVIWAVKKLSKTQDGMFGNFSNSPSGMTSEEILKTRYARGEITQEEYQQILGDLRA